MTPHRPTPRPQARRLLRLHDELDDLASSSRASWKGAAILTVIVAAFGVTLFQLGIGSEAAVEMGVLVLAGAGIIGGVEIARRRRIRGLREEIGELERSSGGPDPEASWEGGGVQPRQDAAATADDEVRAQRSTGQRFPSARG